MLVARTGTASSSTQNSSPASMRSTSAATRSASIPRRCACSSATTLDFVRAGAEADRRRARALRRHRSSGSPAARHPVRPERPRPTSRRRCSRPTEAEIAGLPEFARAAAAETARDRKRNAPGAVTRRAQRRADPAFRHRSGRARKGAARLRHARRQRQQER